MDPSIAADTSKAKCKVQLDENGFKRFRRSPINNVLLMLRQ